MIKLKIYTDENVDIRVAEGLRRRGGITAFSAIERGLIGISDIEHYRYASNLQAVIFTHDHHFLKIAQTMTKEGSEHWRLIFSQMNKLSIGECVKRLSLYVDLISAEEMKNRIEFL